VPQSPNPALKTVEPLFRSATASSAFLYTFEAPFTTTWGAGSRFAATFACWSRLMDVVWSWRARGVNRRGAKRAGVAKKTLRLEFARQRVGTRLVAIVALICIYLSILLYRVLYREHLSE
jgi:hypothetical protein